MKNKKINEYTKDIQEVFLKSTQLISHGNKEYAEELLLICLEKAPESVDARRSLREIQAKKKNSFMDKLVSQFIITKSRFFFNKLIKNGDFSSTFLMMERALCKNFSNKHAFISLLKIAEKADYLELVEETLEYAVRQFPNDLKLKFSLADAYIKVEKSRKAVEIMRELLKLKPNSIVYQRKLQEANAIQVIDEKDWESDN